MKILRISVGVCSFIMLCYCQSFADGWHIETVDATATGIVGYSTSIALDSLDYPHISYLDETNGEDLKYAYWTGSAWSITFVDTVGDVGSWTSIALDSSDYPHISYCDWGNADLKYAYWTGSAWSITSVDSTGHVGYCTSIALDSSDYPHISYEDYTNKDLKYAHWTGSAWSITSVDTAGDVGSWTSIALDSSDYPHISYYDETNDDLKYTYWTGSAWSISSVDTAGDVGYLGTSIALDSSDHPHISYYDYTNNDLKYAYWNGSAWSITSVDTDGVVGDGTSIALDSSDNPHISYLDLTHYDLKYAYWTGSTWSITSVDTAGNVGAFTSIALDSSDNPHISYFDDYPDYYLKYAWYGPNIDINLTSFSAADNGGKAVVLNWSVDSTEGEQIAGFNLYRREITTDSVAEGFIASPVRSAPPQNKNDWTKINPALITGQNPYEYTDEDVQGGLTYEYRLEAVLADESTEILGTASCAPAPPAFAITKLYPNPASDMLTCLLSVPDAGLVKLELYDLSGRLVASQKLEATQATDMEAVINVSSLTSGVYTLKATCNGAEANAQCVVAK